MDDCNWCRQITEHHLMFTCLQSLLQILVWKNTLNMKECMAVTRIEWMAATRMKNYNSVSLKRGMDCKCLFQRNTVPLKELGHYKWPPEKIMVPLKCMAASAPLK